MFKDRAGFDLPNLNGFERALSLERKRLLSRLFSVTLWRTVCPALLPSNTVSKWRMAEWTLLPVSAALAYVLLSLHFLSWYNPLCVVVAWNPSFAQLTFDIEQYSLLIDGYHFISIPLMNNVLTSATKLAVIKSAWHIVWFDSDEL